MTSGTEENLEGVCTEEAVRATEEAVWATEVEILPDEWKQAYQAKMDADHLSGCSLLDLNDSKIPYLVTLEGIYFYENGSVSQIIDAVELGGVYQIYSGRKDTFLMVGGAEGSWTKTYSVFDCRTFEVVDKMESHRIFNDEGEGLGDAYKWMSHPEEAFSELTGNEDVAINALEQWESEYPNSMDFADLLNSVEEAYQSYLNFVQ